MLSPHTQNPDHDHDQDHDLQPIDQGVGDDAGDAAPGALYQQRGQGLSA
jgi:hypothetical protein